MAYYYVDSANSAHWVANTAYSLGTRVIAKASNTSAARRKLVYECTTAGTSHATTEPTWPTVGNTVNDNGTIWTARAPTSWANAHGSLIMMVSYANLADGDIVLIDDGHSENIGATNGLSNFDPEGTFTSPNYFICVDKNNGDALSSGASITFPTTMSMGTNYAFCSIFINVKLVVAGSYLAIANKSALLQLIGIGSNLTLLQLAASGSYLRGSDDNIENGVVQIYNGNIQLDFANNYIQPAAAFEWKKGALIAPNGVTSLINGNKGYIGPSVLLSEIDLTAIGANTLFSTSSSRQLWLTLNRCKLPSNLANIYNSFGGYGDIGVIKIHHSSYDRGTYGFIEDSYQGRVSDETTIVRTGGASDGTTPFSFKMASSANCGVALSLKAPIINAWNSLTSEIAVTVHGIIDSATNLQDDEVWMEVEYPASATSGLGEVISSRKLAIVESVSDLASSTETWADGSMTNPNKFKMTATFIPAQAGPIAVRVCIGRASQTIYICPKAEVVAT
jgi:hypothetical protein